MLQCKKELCRFISLFFASFAQKSIKDVEQISTAPDFMPGNINNLNWLLLIQNQILKNISQLSNF